MKPDKDQTQKLCLRQQTQECEVIIFLRKQKEHKPVSCDGIEECRKVLKKASKNVLPGNFIERMACIGGCVGDAVSVLKMK